MNEYTLMADRYEDETAEYLFIREQEAAEQEAILEVWGGSGEPAPILYTPERPRF